MVVMGKIKVFLSGLPAVIRRLRGAYPSPNIAFGDAGAFHLYAYESELSTLTSEKPPDTSCRGLVPGTGFEPAHPCERCDLNTVRLPVSPPGQYWITVIQGVQM